RLTAAGEKSAAADGAVAKVKIVAPHPGFTRRPSFPAQAATADIVDALTMTPGESFDRETCHRAAAKPNNHTILDDLDCGPAARFESVHMVEPGSACTSR
ncbi:MAG: hypothetical protein WBF47_07295, partial [Xanthobacteraceae bacterium]